MARFFIKSGNYFETITDVEPDESGAWSDDRVSVAQRPSADHVWQGGAWVYVAPAPRDLDAEAAALADQLDRQGSLIHALGVEVFQLAKAANPALTAAEFKARIAARIKGGL